MWKKPAVITIVILSILLCGCGGGKPATQGEHPEEREEYAEVPAEYQGIFNDLEGKLEDIDNYLASNWDGEKHGTIFSVELVLANSHRGKALLYPETYSAIQRTLDSLESLGVTGITLSINYPVISPSYDSNGEYLDFYRKLSAEIRDRGFTLLVETGNTFKAPAFSALNVNYAGLTLDQYKKDKRQMAETVLREFKPQYLTIEDEPTTQQTNTGLDFSVANQTDIVNYILNGLDRSGARIGAGQGTWESLSYTESLAANTSLDYIDMHIYPIQGDLVVDRAVKMAEAARSHGKGTAVGEVWLYKLSNAELATEGGNWTKIYGRDPYSFWIPLDQKFLEVMVKLSHYLEMEYFSPFWMQYLYSYLDYDSSTAGLDYGAINKLANQEAWQNIQSNTLSPTGESYRDLITGQAI